MEDIAALIDYFRKIRKTIDNADFTFFKYKFVKKNKIDDLLVCTLAKLPDSYKKAMKKRLNLDVHPSVSCYNRLSKLLKRPFPLSNDLYMVDYGEANSMLKTILLTIERDIRALEQE